MNKILIKGILVITLITAPTVITVEVMAYELLKAPRAAIVIQEDGNVPSDNDISNVLAIIDDNTRTIQRLLKDKTNTVNKIDATMASYATTKTYLSNQQIDSFQQFTTTYQNEITNLQASLIDISNNKLDSVTSEMISLEPDNSTIYDNLDTIISYQNSAINSLLAIVNAGSNALSFL